MTSYSSTPLAKKLGIKPGHRVLLVGPPKHVANLLEPLPDRVTLLGRAGKPVNVILCFARRLTDLRKRFPTAQRLMVRDGGLWICWPKKSSGVTTDLSFENVQRTGLDAGLVDNKVCAFDETWSALRFVYRLKDR